MEKLIKFLVSNKISFKLIAKDNLYELHILSYTSDKELLEVMFLVQMVYKKESIVIVVLPSWE